VDEFIRRFEAGTLRREEWTHAAHLRMAHWYVWQYPEKEAGVRIRAGIRHLNECMGVANTEDSGFHETLTEFWIREVRALGLVAVEEAMKLPADLWKRDYGSDIVRNRRARREYVKPGEV
jgi:hypothetical protein